MRDGVACIYGRGHIAFEKAWNIMVFIIASNVGMRLYTEKEQWELIGLKNHSGIPFITSDQPVINLYLKEKIEENINLKEHEFELYYPISPSYAVVLKHIHSSLINYKNVTIDIVEMLNLKIKNNSNVQLFSNMNTYLEIIKNA